MTLALLSILLGVISLLMPPGETGLYTSIGTSLVTGLIAVQAVRRKASQGRWVLAFKAAGFVLCLLAIGHQVI